MTDHTTLHINCLADKKLAWMLTARIEGLSFEDWVCSKLDEATADINQPWLNGLSEWARVSLLTAGFDSRESVQRAVDAGFELTSINNTGNRVKREVLEWLK